MPDYVPGPRQAQAEYPTQAKAKGGKSIAPLPQFGGVDGYADLERVLTLAYHQSASGKGKDRHARNRPLDAQPITQIPLLLGTRDGLAGLLYQVIKKAQESAGLANTARTSAAKAELLGVIVYAAAAYLHIERTMGDDDTDD